ncbi:MAG: efflux RND transporter periplasmic adaptor subunit [Armatimonadota bacterium]
MKVSAKIWIIRLVIVGLLSGAVYQWGIPLYKRYLATPDKGPDIRTAKAKEGPFKVSFHQNGALEAKVSVPVLSSIRGKIIKLVDEGSIVKTGDTIAQLDTEGIKKEIRDAKLKLENYLAEIKRYENQLNIFREQNKSLITQAQMQLDYDNSELDLARQRRDRKKALADDKIIAREDVEALERILRDKELNVRIGQMNLELKRKEAVSNENQIMSYLETFNSYSTLIKAELNHSEMQLKKAMITAPVSGMVILAQMRDNSIGRQRPIRAGDDVNPQNSICEIPDLSSMLVKAQVSEFASPRVLTGMKVLLKFEAVQNRIFHGEVTNIANLATTEDPRTGMTNASGAKTLAVMIAITDKDTRSLKPGMTADVEFLEKSIDRAIYIPKVAIIEKNGMTTVFKRIGKSFVNVPVETGSVSDTSVCITSGIKKGDIIALRDPTSIDEEISSLGTGSGRSSLSSNGSK